MCYCNCIWLAFIFHIMNSGAALSIIQFNHIWALMMKRPIWHPCTSCTPMRKTKYFVLFLQSRFQGVFPVKCNHSKELIDSILEYGQPMHGLGLEAGSKAELVLATSMLSRYPGSTLICNGYKDAEYIELVTFLLLWKYGASSRIWWSAHAQASINHVC